MDTPVDVPNDENHIEQPIIKERPKRGRIPNQHPKKTDDPDYFKKFYLAKTQPRLYTDDNLIKCEYCCKYVYRHTVKRHLQTKGCLLSRQRQEQEQNGFHIGSIIQL